MPLMSRPTRPEPPTPASLLGEQAGEALRFPVRADRLVQPASALAERAAEEASFGRIGVDERGLTAGMRLHLFEPARAHLAEWRQARSGFDVALEPARGGIEAVRRLEGEIAGLAQARDAKIAAAEAAMAQDGRYRQAAARFGEAEQLWTEARDRNGGRAPNMRGLSPFYWAGLLLIGVAEWLINYDTFFIFTGIPAIAVGATAVLGVALAFAAHGHGSILKQWAFRFGAHRERARRFGDWRLIGLSTLALLVVLAAAGGSRYAAVLHTIASQAGPNLLGADAVIEVHPLRDVLLSLLANVAAWLVGVFLAYLTHDVDPDYVDATHQYAVASRRFYRRRAPVVDRIRTIEAQADKDLADKRRAAATRAAAVGTEKDLLDQVDAHGEAVLRSVGAVLRGEVETYRDALARLALDRRGEIAISIGSDGRVLTPYDYKALPLVIDDALLRELAG